MDPEPGRCRRTDGKKWRCSRDVVAGHKYCERHMHRGRNRSRKPVEIPTPNSTITNNTNNNTSTTSSLGFGGSIRTATVSIGGQHRVGVAVNGPSFFLSGSSPSTEHLHLNQSSSEIKTENKSLFEDRNGVGNSRTDGHILRHFFDDWPRSLQEPESSGSNGCPMSSATCLSISMPGNSSSDVSLKLSTGNEDNEPNNNGDNDREQPNLNWGSGWGGNQMGGPLAEALRSSTSSSPTSVLHQLPRGGISG